MSAPSAEQAATTAPEKTTAPPVLYPHPQLVLWTVCLIGLLAVAGVALPYPILAPLFAAAEHNDFNHWLGLEPTLLFGIALAANPLGILAGSAVLGALSDSYGRRPVLLGALLLAVLGYCLSAVAIAAEQYLWFVLARFLTGLCEGSISIARAIAADLHPQIDRTKAIAWINAALYGGWLVGPLVGGFTLQYGADTPFWIAAATMLPCLALVYFLLPKPQDQPSTQPFWQSIAAHNSLQLLRLPQLRWVVLIQLCYTLGLNTFYEFYPLWLVQAELFSGRDIGLITAALCLVMVTVSVGPMSHYSHAYPPLRGALVATLLLAAVIAWLPLLQGLPAWLLLVGAGVPIAMMGTWFNVYCAERFDSLGQGRLMGMLTLLMCTGNVITALLGSWIALFGVRWTLWCGAICIAVASGLLLMQQRQHAQTWASSEHP